MTIHECLLQFSTLLLCERISKIERLVREILTFETSTTCTFKTRFGQVTSFCSTRSHMYYYYFFKTPVLYTWTLHPQEYETVKECVLVVCIFIESLILWLAMFRDSNSEKYLRWGGEQSYREHNYPIGEKQ